jgi:hypothetical protein
MPAIKREKLGEDPVETVHNRDFAVQKRTLFSPQMNTDNHDHGWKRINTR